MFEEVKIKVPYILDDPIAGRVLAVQFFFPYNRILGTDYENIIIKEGKLILQGSILSGRKTTSFQLSNIEKLILRNRKVSPFEKCGKIKIFGRLGIEIELSLFDAEGKEHVIIPIFLLNTFGGLFGKMIQKNWERFLRELSLHTGLPIEERDFS